MNLELLGKSNVAEQHALSSKRTPTWGAAIPFYKVRIQGRFYALRSSRQKFEFFATPFYFRFRDRLPFHVQACQQTFKILKLVLTT